VENIQSLKDLHLNTRLSAKTIADNAIESYRWWRLIAYGMLSYTEASHLPLSEILEAEAALDIKLKQESEQLKSMFGHK
jgi:hypothetical protein